jgi:molecular chaperone DnaK (HSP70)
VYSRDELIALVQRQAAAEDSAGAANESSPMAAARSFLLSGLAALAPTDRFVLMTPQAVGCVVVQHLFAGLRTELGFGGSVKAAVVTVPAEFSPPQRMATAEAYARAGVAVARVLPEPAAAAIAYGLHRDASTRHVLVFDMGGGTLDVSLLYAQDGAFTVIGSSGDGHLGGEDFDHCLLRYIVAQLARDHGVQVTPDEAEGAAAEGAAAEGAGVRKGKAAPAAPPKHDGDCTWSYLKHQAEKVKIALDRPGADTTASWSCKLHSQRRSTQQAAAAGGASARLVYGSVSRGAFESTCAALFERVLVPVREALDGANLDPAAVDQVVLVGGMSRLPRVRELLRDMFKKPLRFTVDPDLAVASGAALIVD